MFAVKPLPDMDLQREICADLGTDYFEGSYSYLAAELADDRSTVVAVIGICQFYMTDADGARRDSVACPRRRQRGRRSNDSHVPRSHEFYVARGLQERYTQK